ncbi:2,3-diaminopropionate biosynthesis protein SbnA [Micromonospora sp. CA-263727]|uniref:2,3-diaminopropionate biosynthesis protein SbnA n=1 Tax=Micromonospora sp. CA-263727 TaxID=3239967 RepID=UPI003D930C0B
MKTQEFVTGLTGAIGATPLVELTRLGEAGRFRAFAKLEGVNPGGSMKDRVALRIVREAIRSGQIVTGRTVLIESSSGNLGIGLAHMCAYFGIRFICVVDPRSNAQNIAIMRALGAEVEMVTETDPATGEYLPARIARARELAATTPNGFWTDQYSNPLNAQAHHDTMREITEAAGPVDLLFCPTSSCGTLRGCADYIRAHGLPTRIVAVDAVGSVIFGQPAGPRLIPGHGAAVRPKLYGEGLADRVVHVDDADCVVGCRRLARREAILAGGSSGAVVAALDQVRDQIPPGATCVLILPDRGERYLDTIYNDAWVNTHFGDMSHLWKQADAEVASC